MSRSKRSSAAPLLTTPRTLVTVGVPVYNGERYLESSLAALLAQTHKDLEILISDNCSSDRTAEICRRFADADPRIDYVRQPANIGPLANFQHLLDRATGKYFMWHAADDSAEPQLIEALVAALEGNPAYAVAGADVRFVDEAGETLRIERLTSVRLEAAERDWPGTLRGFFNYHIDNRYLLVYGLFRADLAQRCSIDCDGRLAGLASVEIPFLAQIACTGRALSIDRPLKIYRVHGESAYQTEAREAGRREPRLRHYLNIWSCLWAALRRSGLPGTARASVAVYLLASFPVHLARFAWRAIRR